MLYILLAASFAVLCTVLRGLPEFGVLQNHIHVGVLAVASRRIGGHPNMDENGELNDLFRMEFGA